MCHQDPQTASPGLNSFLLSPLPQNYTCAFPCCHMSKGPPAAFPSNRCGVNPWGTLAALSQCLHSFKKKNPQSGSTREIILQCPRSLLGLSPWWEPARGIEGSGGHVSIRGKSLVMGAWEDLQQCGVPHEYKILLRSTLSKELLSALWTLGYIPHSPPWPYGLRPAPSRPRHSLRSHLSKLADDSSDRELGDLHI